MPDPVADFFASQPRRPVSPAPARSTEDDLAGTIFADPVRDFFLHEGLHPGGPTVDERHPILSRVGRFSAGVMKPFKSIYDEVSTTGREASELARAGNLPGAFERVARPILSPFASLQRAAAGDIPVAPADRAAAATQGLEMAGIPASGIKASYDKGDWLDLAGQAVGTGALLALPDAGMKLGEPTIRPVQPAWERFVDRHMAPTVEDFRWERGANTPFDPGEPYAVHVGEPPPDGVRVDPLRPDGLYPPGLPPADPVAALFEGADQARLPARGTGPITPEPTRGSIAAVPPVVDEASRWQRPNTPPEPPAAPPRADPIESLLRSIERPAPVSAPAGAVPDEMAATRARLKKQGYPDALIEQALRRDAGSGDTSGRASQPASVESNPSDASLPSDRRTSRTVEELGVPASGTRSPLTDNSLEALLQGKGVGVRQPSPDLPSRSYIPDSRNLTTASAGAGGSENRQPLVESTPRTPPAPAPPVAAEPVAPMRTEVSAPPAPVAVDALHQDPRWQHLDDRALIDELDRAARTASDAGYEIPSMESALRAAGVDQARPWWKDFGDDSFDPAALEPSVPSEPSSTPDPLAAALEPAPRATFAFHQPDFEGGSFPMYHVEGGPSDRSTVSADTLREMGIPVPADAAGGLAHLSDADLVNRWRELFVEDRRTGGTDAIAGEMARLDVELTRRGNPDAMPAITGEGYGDTLDTGELQSRLPGDVGAIRDGEVKTPQFEAPFALDRQIADTTPVQTDALGDLLRRTVAEPVAGTPPAAPDAPTAIQPAQATVRPNVKDFLTKRLNYSPEEVDAMGPDAAVAIGNKVRFHPEGIQAGIAAHAKPKPEPAGFTEPDPYFESPAVEQDALEKVLGIQRRMKGAKAPMVPAETVNEPVRGEIPPRSLADPVKRGEKLTATERADLGLPPEVPAKDEPKPQSEVALAKSKMTADARDRAKLLENPTPENLDQYVKLLGEAADRQADREFKGGTGKDDTLRTNERTGEYLASGLGGLEKLYREQPDTFWRLMRGAGGALIGALVEPDDPLRGALIGGLAGGLVSPSKVFAAMRANAPGVAKALKDTIRPPAVPRDLGLGVRAKRGPGDISPTELVAGQPMRTLPDLWHQIREDLHLAHEASTEPPPAGVSPETWARTTRAIYLKEATATVDRYARDAEKAGNKLAAIYARGMAASMRGAPTIAERLISGGTLGTVSPKQARTVIRGVENAVYTNLLVGALDSGLVNRTQLLMAFPHLGKEGILEGIRQSRTSEGQAIAQPVSGETATDAPSQHNPIAPLERKITNQAVRKFVDAAWSPIGVADVANRKQTYLGALFIARKYGLSGPDAHAWALDVTEQSQGVAGELGSNPFHRHLGFLRMFTKFPTIAVQLAHDIATHPDPKVRQRGLLLVSGAKIAGTLIGVGLLDLLVPRLSIANAAVSGVSDVAKHVFGVSDHALSEDLDPRRGGSALVGRYPMKLGKELGHFAADGFGTHHVRDATGAPKGEHSPWSGFMSLLGLKTAEVADERANLDDAYSWVADQRRRRGIQTRLAKEDLARGDASAAAGLSRDQLRAFYRAQQRDQLQRLRQQVPAADRAEFDRRFKPSLAEAR